MTECAPLAVLACSPLIVWAVHAALARAAGPRSSGGRQLTAMAAGLLGAPLAGAAVWRAGLGSLDGAPLAWAAAYAALVYGACAYSYFHVFNMSETARRIRILHELGERGEIDARDFGSSYAASAVVAQRLERLEAMGQVSLEGGRWSSRASALAAAAWVLAAWGKVLGFPEGGGRP